MGRKRKIKLVWVGKPGEYVQGYPRRDLAVTAAEVERLIATGCYALTPNPSPSGRGEMTEAEVRSDG